MYEVEVKSSGVRLICMVGLRYWRCDDDEPDGQRMPVLYIGRCVIGIGVGRELSCCYTYRVRYLFYLILGVTWLNGRDGR